MSVQAIIGRATHAAHQQAPVAGTSGMNSFCLLCATWFFGQHLSHCVRCEAPIFRWVTDYDMKFFRRRSSLEGL